MGFVENNIVKMQWDKAGWLQPKVKKTKKEVFVFGSQTYDSALGFPVTVFFTPSLAFIFADDDSVDASSIWSADDLISFYKEQRDSDFSMFEQCVPVIASGELECYASVLEKYGLVEFKSDIEARLNDVRPYGEEEDVKM